jgi:ferredoxin-NADP reductase
MIHKNTDITIVVKENRPEINGQRSILFHRPQDFLYESGDWIDVRLPEGELRGGRTYSLSSSPTEPDLMITFKDGISELKTALMALRPNDALVITQYGNDYKFTLKPLKASTLIAGGIGIAPFRSMIKEMFDTDSKSQVDLIYMNKDNDFLFNDELIVWMGRLTGLRISYIVTRGLNRKARTKTMLATIKTPGQLFYIAGPEGMVESTEHMLLDFGVKSSNIRIDGFGGY